MDGRIRAVTPDAPHGWITFESYGDWPDRVTKLEGSAKVGQSFDRVQHLNRLHSSHGYEPKLLGRATYELKAEKFITDGQLHLQMYTRRANVY